MSDLTPASPRGSAPFRPSTALLTDHYELTMLQATLDSGRAERRSIFEAFGRRLPAGRRYGIVAGTGRILEMLADFTFTSEELKFLESTKVVDSTTLDWLADFRFSGDIRGYAEGEVYFPGSPLLSVEATFAEAVVLETMILSALNYDSAVASAASRMSRVAGSRPCVDMGSRRTHEQSAVAAARATVVAGFTSTSNLEAGRRYGLTTVGTAAHSFTLIHDSEREAFEAQVRSLGSDTILLLDTYDVDEALKTAIAVAGTELGGVRLDSGDLGIQAAEVREKLDALGAINTRITVTSDLDEYAIAGLAAAPVDAYGVGTRVVTGSGAPTASLVYKLVAHSDDAGEWVSVQKKATGKSSTGGMKEAARIIDGTIAVEEAIGIPRLELPDDLEARPLQVPLVTDGEIDHSYTGPEGVQRARERHAASMAELPRTAHRLQAGEPAIPTVFYSA
ncbi:nicotinate phosphoribosyltransferase [Brevibacterium luteolum]|uniref:nicotinate phosphoribosyltransferase n=1 Tax=Brevibacterium luteolum TaxID=199591 RepID=UPI0021AF8A22|nr:nicotinate phosphoribosyltransferase [Brevibacterium luteolum]MCT1872564.1 nicotinate phosphoribosyltransferase [Brevibacterium luteolum]MCT1891698.1 nicotinate phosphoribosyltransferase [Brevibacterium luteolum]MCT1892805.1 nicotinate phosphoribosyltransferase [Brevibacterium luteolum]MCT1925089.1 nicotinate phosphoribosyltransferase [Brevibacterium luteolum]